jgi:hypothetical protein
MAAKDSQKEEMEEYVQDYIKDERHKEYLRQKEAEAKAKARAARKKKYAHEPGEPLWKFVIKELLG